MNNHPEDFITESYSKSKKAFCMDLVKFLTRDKAEDVIHSMPEKGMKSYNCQRIILQQAINEFSYRVNGIEQEDLEYEEN